MVWVRRRKTRKRWRCFPWRAFRFGTTTGKDGASDAGGTNVAVDACSSVMVVFGSCVGACLGIGIPALCVGELFVVGDLNMSIVGRPDNVVMIGSLRPVAGWTEGRYLALSFPTDGASELSGLVGTSRLDAGPAFGLVEGICSRSGSGSEGRHVENVVGAVGELLQWACMRYG